LESLHCTFELILPGGSVRSAEMVKNERKRNLLNPLYCYVLNLSSTNQSLYTKISVAYIKSSHVHLFKILKHLETKLPRSAKNITFMAKILSKPHIGISGWKMEHVQLNSIQLNSMT